MIGFLGVLILAIVVGVIVGGGTGTTVTAIAGALLALTLFSVGGGIGVANHDVFYRDRTLEEEKREREKRRD